MKLYGEFDEKGYHFEAYLPSNEEDPNEFYVKVNLGDETVRELHIPLTWTPLFGPDTADVAELENQVDKLLKEMERR